MKPKGNAMIVTSASAKIDALMATFSATALMSTNPWWSDRWIQRQGHPDHEAGPRVGQDLSDDGGVQCRGADVDQPVVVAAEHLCDLKRCSWIRQFHVAGVAPRPHRCAAS